MIEGDGHVQLQEVAQSWPSHDSVVPINDTGADVSRLVDAVPPGHADDGDIQVMC